MLADMSINQSTIFPALTHFLLKVGEAGLEHMEWLVENHEFLLAVAGWCQL